MGTFLRSSHAFGMLLIIAACLADPAFAQIKLCKGQTVYVPAYSHIYHGDRERHLYLSVTLSVRNTDPDHPISITQVSYNDSTGKRIKNYLGKKTRLGPFASIRFVVKESDKSGGSGASFIVKWTSDRKVTQPIIETIMISTSSQQGVSFSSRGQVIKEIN